jgi:hypothetical protein
MLRPAAFVVGVCLSASPARGDVPTGQTSTLSDAAKEASFDALFEKAERAKLAGRYSEAAANYSAALELKKHPVLSGRLGLVLVKLGQLDRAAEELHEAVERGQGVSVQERRDVGAAYDKAKALTTWVNVDISHAGAKVTYDDSPRNREGFSSFWMFALPGEHTLRATLDGYQEAVATFTAKPGEELEVKLQLVPLAAKLPELPQPVPAAPPQKRTFPPYLTASNVATDPNYSPNEDPFFGDKNESPPEKKKGTRLSVNGGIVTVFGVASWNPAVGVVVGVNLKPKEFLSLGLEGRAAWLTTGVGGGQIRAMTAGGILSACGHIRWFFGCGIGSIGALNIAFSAESYTGKSSADLIVGGGGRVGASFHASESFVVLGSIDVLKLSSGTKVAVNNQIIADIPPIMIGGQISGGWEF